MALTEQDRETIELMATKILGKFHESQRAAMEKMAAALMAAVNARIEQHQATCPHGRQILESRWFLAGGVCVAVILVKDAATAGGWLLKLLTGI